MRARQARKILRHYNGGKMHKLNWYWFDRLWFYKIQAALGDNAIMGWLDHRITEALKVYQRHGRVHHPLAQR